MIELILLQLQINNQLLKEAFQEIKEYEKFELVDVNLDNLTTVVKMDIPTFDQETIKNEFTRFDYKVNSLESKKSDELISEIIEQKNVEDIIFESKISRNLDNLLK